jgi:polyhydroxyalkanoate synthesis regulator phasin
VDRLIERLRHAVEGATPDPMMQLIAGLVERGEITVTAARAVRDLYRQQRQQEEKQQ